MMLGYPRMQNFQLVEDIGAYYAPPGNVDDLISQAFCDAPRNIVA